ncbi:MAG: prenyltransferase/squalene oxidase repeat-containing protein [Planctomycetota bacterium]|jgi:geranylgeranyl transferase type-2 subunit beta|nr:prenyltransferase/squalene oxidase repeat-containing protein [Planctomycetota bacterium]MDP6503767.1 prenyltransferase/squalene oxidase repeat-containing protein [Planctomycetota bacterium]
MSYLLHLNQRLAAALAQFPENFRNRHGRYLHNLQCEDGGFPDREGGSDLYYTGFALRGLECLGSVKGSLALRAGAYLRSCLHHQATIIDFLSLLYASMVVKDAGGPALVEEAGEAFPDRVAAELEKYRKDDGGYARAIESASGSTYHSFLVALCYEMIERELPEQGRLAKFILERQREDGGFVEVKPARKGGTNPTAAALALLVLLGEVEEEVISSAVEFLVGMQSPEGGLKANGRIPAADVLSTFTGLLTLTDLGFDDELELDALRDYVERCEIGTGGFRGGIWDEGRDAEYTFYGLGSLALVSGAE